MSVRLGKFWWSVLLLCLIFISFVGCSVIVIRPDQPIRIRGEFSALLPGGYLIFASNSRDVTIEAPSWGPYGSAVGAKVDQIAVRDHWVVGHVDGLSNSSIAEVPGYFILDTNTDHVITGLSRAAWESQLGARGFKDVPVLEAP